MSRAVFPGLFVVAAIVQSACATPDYGSLPFTCVRFTDCPTGYRCSASYCIRDDQPDLPTLVERSHADFLPTVLPDVDRNGAVACWSRAEDQDNPQGGVFGAFLGPDGVVHSGVRLATFDTRGVQFRTTCAPVPHSGGQIVVAAFLQSNDISTVRLVVWTPDAGDMFHGTSRDYFEEANTIGSSLALPQLGGFAATIVGDQAWIPVQESLQSRAAKYLPPSRVARLRVGAAELAAGIPDRDIVLPSATEENYFDVEFAGSTDGAWLAYGQFTRNFGFVPSQLTGPVSVRLIVPPALGQGFGEPLATDGQLGDMTHPPRLAALWNGSSVGGVPATTTYRVAWITQGSPLATQSAPLPFTALDTRSPRAMRIDEDLYLFGTPGGAAAPTAGDGGDGDGGMDAAAPDDAPAPTPTADAGTGAVITMYRIPWGSPATTPIVAARTIPRQLGNSPVSALIPVAMPDGLSFGLYWIEFYGPDPVGHGAHYAAFFQRFGL